MPDQAAVDIPVWAYLLAVALPALIALAGVIYQGRKTRDKGTEEHLRAWDVLRGVRDDVGEIRRDVSDLKRDVSDLKGADRELDHRVDHLETKRRLKEGA